MNTNTNKIVESVNVDEYLELYEVVQKQEPEDYKTFIYYYDGMSTEELEIQVVEKFYVIVESHTVNVESHLDTKLHTTSKLQSDNVELPKREVHSNSKVEHMIVEERRIEPRLSKYVRRHHPVEQIIGDKDARPMTRNKSGSGTCLVSVLEPKIVKDALDNEDWTQAMTEDIE